jgi:hypothetical protein
MHHTVITLGFKDAAGGDHKLVLDGTAVGAAPEDKVIRLTSFNLDGRDYSDLPTWRQLGRQLKAAKGFMTTKDANVEFAATSVLTCVRKKEDGAPDCHMRERGPAPKP